MRYTITNRPELLAMDDEVVFTVNGRDMNHRVIQDRLYYLDGIDREIFDVLEIDDEGFARVVYGYEPGDFCFPEWKTDDFAAATRLVNALFDVIEGREKAGVEKAAPAAEGWIPKIGDKVRPDVDPENVGEVKSVDLESKTAAVYWPKWRGGRIGPRESFKRLTLVEAAPAPVEAPAPAAEAPRFKVGDRVRRVDREIGTVPAGALGTVIEVEREGDEVLVQFDDMRLWYTRDAAIFADSLEALELVTEEAPALEAEAPAPEKAPDTLQEFLDSLPGDLRKLVEKLKVNAPNIKSFVFAASPKDGEGFASGAMTLRYRGTTGDRKSISECAGLASVLLWHEQYLANAEED